MTENQNQPREYDAVLGGQSQVPLGAAILGGIPGIKSRLAAPIVEVKIAALSEAIRYGDVGLDLIVGALQDESLQVKFAVFLVLKDRDEPNIKKQLQKYFPTFDFDAITVNAKGKENSRCPYYAHFFAEDLGNGVVLEMVYIAGGTFMMGSPNSEQGRYDYENPHHLVTVPAFFAGKYPITQAQWEAVMGNNPSGFKGEKRCVENVSWDDAVEFCAKVSQKNGKKYRLLSEAEWEYACRAKTTTEFHFGENITPDLVNYHGYYPYANAPKGLSRKETTNVGRFPPNAFGLYDMHGNVWEWCSDRWHENYNGAPTDGSCWETGTSEYRMLRGGSWDNYAVNCRSADRNWLSAGGRRRKIGFRVAVDLA
ncbi:formylglycine-generating enzyme family protein [Microcoleus sp. MOSTC5]|uniref:formylglycine-generating enzyme family protein n=1 Tax=Microcoleus sp. MOSTC5 TaxID=3055378 RepID=UPI002FD53966